jgi:DNA-binding MarR family transcriptional regulator
VHEGPDYDFDHLCEWLLPYTREQVRSFRDDAKARAEAAQQWAQWDENRAKAQAVIKRVWTAAESAALEAQQSLWWHRLDAIRAIAAARGGIEEGQRNNWAWIVANALAWGLGSAEKLHLELPQVVREIAPSYSYRDAQRSASSVIKRLNEGREALYRMRTSTLAERLGLTADEYKVLRAATQAHPAYNPGVMGFPKLAGLTFEDWLAEVRRRQGEGGRYSASIRSTNHPYDKRAKALELRDKGLSTRAIAHELAVGHMTVWRWVNGW